MKTELVNGCYGSKSNDRLIYYNQQGQIHREDGPALIRYYRDGRIHYEQWCGLKHRHDYTKPAYKCTDGRCYYYWYGVKCKPEELLDKDFRDRIQLERLG